MQDKKPEEKDIESTEEKKSDDQNLKIELEKEAQKAEDNFRGWQRALADYQNLKKESAKQQIELSHYVKKDLALKLLPLIDNFDQAVKHVPENMRKEAWVDGFFQLKKCFEMFLADIGVEKIDALSKPFDPFFHEAMLTKEDENFDDNVVLEVLVNGYQLAGQPIKPAKVVVNQRKSK